LLQAKVNLRGRKERPQRLLPARLDIIVLTSATLRGKKLASITIRDVDDELRQRLQARAAGHGQSIEAEARDILREALRMPETLPATNLYAAIRAVVEPLGGIGLDIPARQPIREAPRFE
jgi:plasmid stability protein